MLVLNLPFKALMFLTLMRPSLVLFLVLWLKLVKDFLKVRCRLALLPFLISCLIWLDLVASLPLIKERILVIILLLHFLSLMLGSVLVLMLPLLVWLTPDLRIKKSLLKCNWTIGTRLPRCKVRLKKRWLAFRRRLPARIRKTRYMHKMRCLLVNRSGQTGRASAEPTPVHPARHRSGRRGDRPIRQPARPLRRPAGIGRRPAADPHHGHRRGVLAGRGTPRHRGCLPRRDRGRRVRVRPRHRRRHSPHGRTRARLTRPATRRRRRPGHRHRRTAHAARRG